MAYYIRNGETSEGIILSANSMRVSYGGAANSTTLNYRGMMYVEGGSANDTTVNSGGTVWVSRGGLLNRTTVNSGGIVSAVQNMTIVYDATVNVGGRLTVAQSAMAAGIKENGGFVNGSNIVFVPNTFSDCVLAYASATVHSGTTAYGATIKEGGHMVVFSGGSASDTTVESNGNLLVSSGGRLAGRLTIEKGAYVSVYSYSYFDFDISGLSGNAVAFVNNLALIQGNPQYTLTVSGMQAEGTYVLAAGAAGFSRTITVRNELGGTCGTLELGRKRNIEGTGYLLSLEDGTLSVTVSSEIDTVAPTVSDIQVSTTEETSLPVVVTAVFADDVELEAALCMTEETGEWTDYVDGVTVSRNTTVYFKAVDAAGNESEIASRTVSNINYQVSGLVVSEEFFEVGSGETALDTIIDQGGYVYVYDGGTANSTMVNQGGTLNLYSGGTATDIIEYGGYVWIEDGASATFAPNSFDGLVLIYESATLHSGTTANSTTVYGYLHVSSGGLADNTTVINYGYLYVSSGGLADNTTVSYGYLHVFSGGAASNTTVNFGGNLYVSSGGTASNTTVNNHGYLYVSSGGAASNTTVNPGGNLYVSSGGTAANIVENGGNVVCDDAAATFTSNSFSGLILSSALATVHSGTTANKTTLDWYGCLYLYDGGTANSTTISSGGTLNLYSGGAASNTTVNSGGYLYVSGGTAADIVENGGCVYLEDGATATFVPNSLSGLILTYASATIHSGTTANNTTVNSCGYLLVSSGGLADNTRVNSAGFFTLYDGGTANNTTISSGGYLYVSSGGKADNTAVNYSGGLYVYGGEATGMTVASGGYLYVSGGTAADIVENGGCVYLEDGATATFVPNSLSGLILTNASATIHSGTTANNTTVNSYGYLLVSSGGLADDTRVNPAGFFTLYDGGTANNTTISSGGYLYVSSGGLADNTAVNYSGGLYVYGGEATGMTVASGGSVFIDYRGKLSGQMIFVPGAYVHAYSGAVISLDISGDAPETHVAQLNDLSVIQGVPSYLLTVSGTQANGSYTLAGGATGFGGSITVQDTDGGALGTLSSGGAVVRGESSFRLAVVDDALILTIQARDTVAPTVSNIQASTTEPANMVEITADFQDNNNELKYMLYKFGEDGDWIDYDGSISVYRNTSVYFQAVDLDGNESEITSCVISNIEHFPGLVIPAGQCVEVLSGDVYSETTVSSEGMFYVSSGGIASGVVVDEGGELYVIAGGTATGIVASEGAYLEFEIAPDTCIAGTSDGVAFEFMDGTLSGYTINDGYFRIASGGTAAGVTVNYGTLNVASDGMASGIAVSRGTLSVASGGTALDVECDPFTGRVNAKDGAYVTYLNSGVYLGSNRLVSHAMVMSSKIVTYAKDGDGSAMHIMSGGIAVETKLNGGGCKFYIYSGGTAIQTDISSGSMTVSSGGTAIGVSGGYSARINVLNGGFVSAAHLNMSARMTISSGGTAEKTVFDGFGLNNLYVYSGGTANDTIFAIPTIASSGGRNTMEVEGTANRTTVNASGYVIVRSGATANSVTVNSSGYLNVYDDGKLTGKVTVNGGRIYVTDGTVVDFDLTGVAPDSDARINNLSMISGHPRLTITVNADQAEGVYILAEGAAGFDRTLSVRNPDGDLLEYISVGQTVSVSETAYTLNLSDGVLSLRVGDEPAPLPYTSSGFVVKGSAVSVKSGEVFCDTTVNPGGTLYVSSGGTALAVKENGGRVEFAPGASVTFAANTFSGTVLSGASATVHSGTTAIGVAIQPGGDLHVFSGGMASELVWTPCEGHVYLDDGASATFASAYSGVYCGSDGHLLSNAASMDSVTLGSACEMYVMSGGSAIGVAVQPGGDLHVFSGGMASELVWTPCEGHVYLYDGASATFASAYSGVYYGSDGHLLSNAATMNSVTLGSACEMYVMSDAIAHNTTVGSGGILHVSSGGLANSVTVFSGGLMHLSSGAYAVSPVVSSGGSLAVSSGGTAVGIVLHEALRISSGGLVIGTTVLSGGDLLVEAGTVSYVAVSSGGGMTVDHGTADDISVDAGGQLLVSSGGTATGLVVTSGARLGIAVAPDTCVAGTVQSTAYYGSLIESEFEIRDGVVSNYEIESGYLAVSSGGTAGNITVKSGGSLYLSSGGTLDGRLWCSGGIVSAFSGSVVDFDLNDIFPWEAARINDLSAIKGKASYTITVNADPREGIYKLAEKASGFDRTITVVNTAGEELGALSVGGTLTVSDVAYTLSVSSGVLTLQVGEDFMTPRSVRNYYEPGGSNSASHGSFIASSGMVFNDIAVGYAQPNTSAGIRAAGGGIVNSAMVYERGSMWVSSGGTFNAATIYSGGIANVYLAGFANSTTVNSGGNMFVSFCGVADKTVVSKDANLRVYFGGIANDTTVNSDGNLRVMPGGIVNGASISSGGVLWVTSGGTATDVSVSSGGHLEVSVTTGTYVAGTSDGSAFELKDGTLSGFAFESAYLYVGNGGVANYTTLGKAGALRILRGGTANSATINVGGSMYVSASGTALKITENGGYVDVKRGARATFAPNAISGLVLSGGLSASLHSMTTADCITVGSGGALYLYGGTASNTTVSSGGIIWISSGGRLNGQLTLETGAVVSASYGIYDFDISGLAPGSAAMVRNLDLICGSMDYTLTVSGSQAEGVYALAEDALSFDGMITVQDVSGEFLNSLELGKTRNIGGTGYLLSLTADTLSLTIGGEVDTVAPTVSGIQASTSEPTRQPVIVTAEFADDVELESSLYMLGEYGGWSDYVDGVTVHENTVIYFQAVDAAGNRSEIVGYTVGNIDITPPEMPAVSADITSPTKSDVILTAVFSEDSVTKEYRIDGQTWSEYTSAVTVTDNCPVYFRAADALGNVSDIAVYVVGNIDRTAPVATAFADTTTLTFEPVAVSVEFDEGNVAGEYSLDGETWQTYTGSVTLAGNGTVFFRGTDAAGNISEIAGYTVSNIVDVISGITLADGETLNVLAGKTCEDIVVAGGGYLNVLSGGTATDIVEAGGYVAVQDGAAITFAANTFSGQVLSYASATLHSGTTAENATINWYGSLDVYDGGAANSAYVNWYGSLNVYDGGAANRTSVSTLGTFNVSSGGVANETNVSSGTFNVYDGGVANDASVSWYGTLNVYGGGVANDVMLDAWFGRLNVYDGGRVNRAAVNYSGSFVVYGGGMADSTTVYWYGRMYVSSGGMADNTTVSSGYLYVSSGASVKNTAVNKVGFMFVYNGGTVDNLFVNDYGSAFVYSGGTVNNLMVDGSNCYIFIDDGGRIAGKMRFAADAAVSMYEGAVLEFDLTGTTAGEAALVTGLSRIQGAPTYTLTVNADQAAGVYLLAEGADTFDGTISVMNPAGDLLGTLAAGTPVEISGVQYTLSVLAGDLTLAIGCEPPQTVVSSGVTLANETRDVNSGELYYSTTVNSGGSLNVLSGGSAKITYVTQSGVVNVSSGGTANSMTVSNGCFNVSSGGTANNATVNWYGSLNVYDGGVANDVFLTKWYGCIYVYSGGKVNRAAVSDSGTLAVSGGGAVDGATVSWYGRMYVSSGGSADNTDVNMYCFLSVLSGGVADHTDIYAKGSMNVQSGGMADGINVYGCLYVSSGGTVDHVTVDSGGSVQINGGGTVTNIVASEGAYLYLMVASDTYVHGTSGGVAFEIKDAYLSGFDVNNGRCYVYNGGTVESTTVVNGTLSVDIGGTAHDVIIDKNGNLTVFYGGRVTGTILDSGGIFVSSGGSLNNTTVNGGYLYVSGGGTAMNIVENGGYVGFYLDDDVTFASNSFSGLVLSETSATVHSGTVADDTTIATGGRLEVYSGGIADHTAVGNGGRLEVHSGGTATGIVVSEGAELYLVVVPDTYVQGTSGGSAFEIRDAFVSGFKVNSRTKLDVYSGGTATDIVENGGFVYVADDASATFAANTISGLFLSETSATVHSGTVVDEANINWYGGLYVYDGGVANNASFNGYYGKLTVYDGGQANNAMLRYSGTANVAGGTVTDTTVYSRSYMYVSAGGTANRTFINNYGYVYVSSGGLALNTTVYEYGRISVCAGAMAENVTVNSYGSAEVFYGGAANDVTVITYGNVVVSSGGTAANVNVAESGSLYIYYGGELTGRMTFADGAVVSAYSGAILDFDLTSATAGDPALVNNLSVVQGAPRYTLAVPKSLPAVGSYTYTLAEGAEGFDSAITVYSPWGTLGTLALGETMTFGGRDYTLNLTDSTLSLTVDVQFVDSVAPTVSNVTADITEPTNQDVTVTATFADDVALFASLYRIGEDGEWRFYEDGGIPLSENATVYFKAVDAFGNESEIVGCTVSNIDKSIPYVGVVLENETRIVSSGEIYLDTTVGSDGTLVVSYGGLVDEASIEYWYGCIYVMYGGSANHIVVNRDGLYVSNGGKADNVMLNNYGRMVVAGGGTATNATVGSGGTLFVAGGGTVTNIVASDGAQLILELASDTRIRGIQNGSAFEMKDGFVSGYTVAGGGLTVSRNCTALEIVENGGFVEIKEGANVTFAPNTFSGLYLSNASATIHSGTTANKTFFSGNSYLLVYAGGVVNDTVCGDWSGHLLVYAGGVANNTVVYKDNVLCISSGGLANNVNVEFYGSMFVSSGGTATGKMRFLNGAYVSMYEGSVLDFDVTGMTAGETALVNDLAFVRGMPTYTLTVSQDQAAGVYLLAGNVDSFDGTVTVVNPAGMELGTLSVGAPVEIDGVSYALSVFAGDLSLAVGCDSPQTEAVVISDVSLVNETRVVSSGEIYYHADIFSGGILDVLSGGMAKYAEIYYGNLIVSSGGTADGTSATWYGRFKVCDGGSATNTFVGSGCSMVVCSGVAEDTVVINATLIVSSGGTATNNWGNIYGYILVSSGGTAVNTTVNSESVLTVLDGGKAESATVNSSAILRVSSGGTANDITVESNGMLFVSSGGTATNIDAANGIYLAMDVAPGTVIQGTSGGVAFETKDGFISGYTVNKDCTLNILSGGTATDIVENGGMVEIGDGAFASFASHTISGLVLSDAVATVHSGTTATDTNLESFGNLIVYYGGIADNTNVNTYAILTICPGGKADGIDVKSYGNLIVSSAGIAENATVESGGSFLIDSGGTATDIVVSDGAYLHLAVAPGTCITGTFGGSSFELKDPFISGYTVNSRKSLAVFSGGTALDIIEDGGYVEVFDGANVTFGSHAISGLSLYEVSATIHSGTTMTDTTVRHGSVFVFSGGIVDDTTLELYGIASVFSGGTVNDTVNFGGRIEVFEGGIVKRTMIDSQGWLVVSSGGMAEDVSIGESGYMYLDSCGRLTGHVMLEKGAWVAAERGSILDFDLTVATAGGPALVNDLSSFEWYEMLYTLTIPMSPVGGTYILAEGAEGFDSTVTVNCSWGTVGTLSLDEKVSIVGRDYTLSLVDSVLTLTVDAPVSEDTVAPTVVSVAADITEPTNQDVTVTATFADDVALFASLYRIGEDGEWTAYTDGGVTLSENATVYFKAIDASGNESEIVGCTVSNIDKSIPHVGVVLENETRIVSSGEAYIDTVISSGGRLIVSDGGFADGTYIDYEDGLLVLSCGTAVNTTANGYFYVSSGGTAVDTAVNGYFVISSGGTAIDTQANGCVEVYSGAVVDTIDVAYARDLIIYGGTVTNITTVYGAWIFIETSPDMYVAGTSDGSAFEFKNGVVSNFEFNRGTLVVFSGCTATDVSFREVGGLFVAKGGVVTDFTADSGTSLGFYVDPGTYISGTSGGSAIEIKGGTVSNHTVIDGYMIIDSGAIANSTAVVGSWTWFAVGSGGIVNDTVVSSGGEMLIDYAGTANNITVASGGSLMIFGEGRATGQMSFENGAVVSVMDYTAVLDFDISGIAPGAAARINDLSVVRGTPLFTLTVSETQANGSYTLAEGAGGFNSTITVRSESGRYLDTISVGGSIEIGDVICELGITDGNELVLCVGTEEPGPGPAPLSLVYVNSEWTGLADGVIISGATIGFDGFATLADGIAAVAEDGAIEVTGGEISFADGYSRSITVDASATVVGTAVFDKAISINGTILFDTACATAETAQFAGFSFVSGSASFVLTGIASAGTYLLASDAAAFSGSVQYGDVVLSVGAGAVVLGDHSYALDITDGFDLVLTVAEYQAPVEDIIAPAVLNIRANVTGPTRADVVVTAEFADDVELASSLFRIGETGEWLAYIDGVTVSENAVVYFKAVDAAGNVSEVASYEVANIDKVAPTAPTAMSNISEATNGNVLVSAQFSEDSAIKEYSLDGENWIAYTAPVQFMDNGSVYFRSTDEAGNISEVTAYEVTNIDKVAPEAPTATADITTATNGNVLVSAQFSEDSVVKEYSLDGQNWKHYIDAISFSDNGMVYFRSTDAAGNMSEIASYEVTNIDRVAPEAPTATADVTTATNGNVLVSAQFSEDSVNKEYSLDGETWQTYTEAVKFTENGTVYFRGSDAAGNVSAVTAYDVTNIESVIPDTTKPTVSNVQASVTVPTNQDVVITAEFADDVALASSQYKIGENGEWLDYDIENGVLVKENTTVYFKAADVAGNVSEIASYEVANIDKVAPDKPTASADVIAPTNGNVTVTAQFSEDSEVKEYSLDGQTWQAYDEGGVIIIINGSVFFRGTDAAGNVSEVTEYAVTNIDKVAPVAPVASADITTATNGNVLVSAQFSEDTVTKEYSLDGQTWQTYTEAVRFTDNGSVLFRSVDAAGNVSEVKEYAVTNIDKVAPMKPTATADITTATNGDVLVSAEFSEDSVVKEYSLDGENWIAYTEPVQFTDNGSVSFRSFDEASNVSEATNFLVSNIDKVAPVAPSASADVTAPTNGNVTVTALFSDDSVTKEYSLDGQTWQAYTEAVKFSENGTVFFRGTDAAGNVSEVASYEVVNIDKVAPVKPTASANITTTTNGDVLVSAQFSEDSVTKEYSLDGETWIEYTETILFTENGTVYFRGTDAAGNVSEVTSFLVSNIETVEVTNAPDDGTNDYLYKKGKDFGWNETNIHVTNEIAGNGEVLLDLPGTIEKDGWHNMFGNDGTNVDTGDVAQVEVDTAAKLTFTVDSDAAGTFYIYEDGFDKKGNRKLITVGKVSVKAGKTSELKDVCLAADGRYYAAMTAKNVRKAGTKGMYNVSVTSSTFFADADDGTNNEADKDIAVEVGRGTTSIVLDSEPMTASTKFNNFVGFGDAADYAKLDLVSSAYMSFSVKADGKSKFTIWKQDAKGKLSKVSTTSLTAKNGFAATTAAKFLDTSKYTYYVSMESTDAKKGGSVYYDVEVGGKSVFFDSADGGLNNVLYDKKAKAFRSDANFLANEVGAGSQNVLLDDGVEADGWQNFVGYGDAVDYAKITLTSNGNLSFTLESTGDATFTVYRKGVKKGKEVLETIQTTKLTLAKGASIAETTTKVLSGLDAGEYYVSMAAKNTKATDKGSVFYNVTANLDVPVSSELSMPETDVPASASVDARLCSASDKLSGESGCGLLASL